MAKGKRIYYISSDTAFACFHSERMRSTTSACRRRPARPPQTIASFAISPAAGRDTSIRVITIAADRRRIGRSHCPYQPGSSCRISGILQGPWSVRRATVAHTSRTGRAPSALLVCRRSPEHLDRAEPERRRDRDRVHGLTRSARPAIVNCPVVRRIVTFQPEQGPHPCMSAELPLPSPY